MISDADSYLSVAGESTSVFRDKASKFIGIALPATSETEVKHHLERIGKEYFDANHHCYAYRLGFEKTLYRTNDDGEPSGSAGKPIYGQILSKDLSDILLIVIRYFGGTKLGVPGLINAYRTSAREALENATIIEKLVTLRFSITFEYPAMNEIMRILKEERVQILGQGYEQGCQMDFQVRKSQAERILSRLNRLNNLSLHLHTSKKLD
jgi:uncharacterized YigZ family protein